MQLTPTTDDIPFNAEGNMLGYSYGGGGRRPNYSFNATLRFAGFRRGRSAANAIFVDGEGHRYSMFLSALEDILKTDGMRDGFVRGCWSFCKRGSNYSIFRLGDLDGNVVPSKAERCAAVRLTDTVS